MHSIKSIPSIESSVDRVFMKIGEVAKKTGCSIQTIRFYERQNLIQASNRTLHNYRVYDDSSLSRLRFIRQCRSLDLSLLEIKQLLATKENPETSCTSINNLIFKQMIVVTKKIEELNELKLTLCEMAEACNDNKTVKECGVLHMLEE